MYLFILFIILACSNDIDILTDAVLIDPALDIEERQNSASENQEETPAENPAEETDIEDGFEGRITEFPPVDDAYVQSGKGYDQTIIRLDENNRTSYLKFDLNPIDDIGGYITDVSLEFTIDSDEGNGTVEIYKGIDSDWTEQEINDVNIPEIDVLLGSITKEYKIGNTEEVELSGSDLLPESTTLILQHKEGNDLAMASKENPSRKGPKLKVKYNAPKSANAIVIVEEEPESVPEETTPEGNNTPAVNEAPMAIADATPSGGGVPLTVSFTGGNSTDDNTIVSYAWDFKDGSSATTANPTHTFTEVGTYDATLTVTDADGLSSSDNVTITVNAEGNAAPVARVTASPLSGNVPLQVNFTGSSSTDDNSIASYSWNFKDGSTANNANPAHTFNAAGTFAVELTVTDENGLSDKETVTITVNEVSNAAPVAKVIASPLSGIAPLQVSFIGSNSTDDNAISSYSWNFKDGSTSNSTNPTHTFSAAGTYAVELTVADANGLSDKETVNITVNQAVSNEAPVAVASANPLSGDAPLVVNFTGSNSNDDNGIVSYFWDIPGNPSTSANTTRTFNTPGVYDITLTVEDASGLQHSDTVTINVTQANGGNTGGENIPCSVGGGKAGDTGHKIWCWNNISITEDDNWDSNSFSNGELRTSTHCNTGMVTRSGDRLYFKVNPTSPAPQSWCSSKSDYNYRSEIRTSPSNVDHPVGTEEWFGWNYRFGNDYKIDNNEWIFWQVHDNSDLVSNPLMSLWISRDNQGGSTSQRGEMTLVNTAVDQDNPQFIPLGITPQAGDSFDIVVHVIWGSDSNGLFELWINNVQIYSKQIRTVPAEWPYGGYAKWGIYKWRWIKEQNIQKSTDLGISELNTSMGTLRMITRRPGDPDYGQNSFSLVAPD